MTDTAINAGLRIALEQINAALRRHGIEPSGDYGADIERLAANSDRYLWLRDECDTTTGFLLAQRLEADEWDEAIAKAKAKGHSL